MGTANIVVYDIVPMGRVFYAFFKVEMRDLPKDVVKVFVYELRKTIEASEFNWPTRIEVEGNDVWVEAVFESDGAWGEEAAFNILYAIVGRILRGAAYKVKEPYSREVVVE